MSETKYGRYIVSDPSLYTLAHGVDVPASEVTGRSSSHIYLDNDLVDGCEKHVAVMRFNEVPHPNPFIEAHAHPHDEILLFLGSNPDDIRDLGGEIELFLGDEGERHVITTTTALFLPRGLRHLLKHKSVTRSHTLIAISMSGEYK